MDRNEIIIESLLDKIQKMQSDLIETNSRLDNYANESFFLQEMLEALAGGKQEFVNQLKSWFVNNESDQETKQRILQLYAEDGYE
jgi:predicted nuclease with TOPRIM domain